MYFNTDFLPVPNVWLRPPNQRKEADAAKAVFHHPDGDHLTLLNVYNQYQQSEYLLFVLMFLTRRADQRPSDLHDRTWAWNNYLSQRSLVQAENVRSQLQRIMERFDIDLVSTHDERRLWNDVRKVLVCGFFMQVAHKEGEKGSYLTVKDNQVSTLLTSG